MLTHVECRAPGLNRLARIAAVALVTVPSCSGRGDDGHIDSREQVTTTPARQQATSPGAIASSAETDDTITVRLMEWRIELSHDTVSAGFTKFTIVNAGTHHHEFEIQGLGAGTELNVLPGGTALFEADLRPGTYEIVCSLREQGIDHAREGMRTILVVR